MRERLPQRERGRRENGEKKRLTFKEYRNQGHGREEKEIIRV